MIVRWDDTEFDLPERAVEGLRTYLQSVADAMARKRGENSDCWEWGRCYVRDVSNSRGLIFQWGSDEDRPKDGAGPWAVLPLPTGGSDA